MKPSTPESAIQVTSKLQDSTNSTSIYSLDGRTHLITKTFSGSPFVVINNYDGTTAGITLPANFNGPFLFPFAMGIAGATSSGDGKTLNLDFTTGTLPSGITFNRGTVGTYLDSDGFVKYAPHNLFRATTTWVTGGYPTWVTQGTAANFSKDGEILTITSNNTVDYVYQQAATIKGLPSTVSVEITGISASSIIASDVIQDSSTGIGTDVAKYYFNGSAISQSTGITTPGILTLVEYPPTTSAVNSLFRIGLAANGINRTGTISLRQPQLEYGAVTNRKYVSNASITLEYYGPRFEYSAGATGLGILVEPRSRNFLKYSNNFGHISGWNVAADLGTTAWPGGVLGVGYTGNGFNSLGGQTAPDGGYAYNLIPNTNNAAHFIKSSANTLSAGFSYAFSAFVKPSGYTGIALVVDNGNAQAAFDLAGLTFKNYINAKNTSITSYANGWYRVCMPFSGNAGAASCWIGPINSLTTIPSAYTWSGNAGGTYGVLAWGAQLETGYDASSAVYNSATSLIPAGDTYSSRNKDSLTVYGITSAMNWNQSEGTLFVNMDVASESNTSGFAPGIEFATDDTNGYRWRILLNNSSGTNPRINSDTFDKTTPTPTSVLSSSYLTRPTGSLGVTGFKYAVSQAQSNAGQTLNVSLNGSAAVAGFAAGSTMGTPIKLQFNTDGVNADEYYFPVHIKNVSYWPYAITGTTLQNLTKP